MSTISNPPAPVAGQNLIVNPTFTINARGYASGTVLASGAYAHDGWYDDGQAKLAYTFSQPPTAEYSAAAAIDNMLTLTAGNIRQTVELRSVVGGTYTLSWLGTVQAIVYYYNGGYQSPLPGNTASPVTFTLPAGVTIIVQFNGPGTLGQVKFEAGAVATPFERRPTAVEASLCRRRFQRRGGHAYRKFGVGVGTLSTQAFIPLPQAEVLRATPTMAYGGNFALYNGSATYPVTSMSLDSSDPQQTTLNVYVSSGLTAGSFYLLEANNDATAHIDLSADI